MSEQAKSFRLTFTPDGLARVFLLKHFPESSDEQAMDLVELFKLMYNQGATDAAPAAPAQEPVAWLFQHDETARTLVLMADEKDRELGSRWHRIRPLYAAPAPAVTAQSFQQRVQPWMMACFGPVIAGDRIERNHRFLEEALELVQSCGCTRDEARQLVDYVYGRPQGQINQEVGGVMVTLAALCLANGIDMHEGGETELARINEPATIEKIRAKQAAKPRHSPLPAVAAQGDELPPPVGYVTREHRNGVLIADGGEIISTAFVLDDQEPAGPLFNERQMRAALAGRRK